MSVRILTGDCREVLATLPAGSARCCVTSPPYYGLRDYGHDTQIGLEATPDEYVAALVGVFRDVRRVLADDGTLWLNLGDSYSDGGSGANSRQRNAPNANWDGGNDNKAPRGTLRARQDGLKPKDLIGIPWRVAFALQADGWYLRQDIIWHKPNPMPESVTDRCTKAHEHIFLLAKSARYYFDACAIMEPASANSHGGRQNQGGPKQEAIGQNHGGVLGVPAGDAGRNKRSVWTVATQPFSGAHFATFPPDLIEPCIRAGSAPGDTILDPFGGAGTTGLVADRLGRSAVLIEANPEYADMARRRIAGDAPLFTEVA